MAQRAEGLQVAPGAAAEVEEGERRISFDGRQQRSDVPRDVVIARGAQNASARSS